VRKIFFHDSKVSEGRGGPPPKKKEDSASALKFRPVTEGGEIKGARKKATKQ